MALVILFLFFLPFIFGVDAAPVAKVDDYNSNSDLFDFAVSSVVPTAIFIIYGPGKKFVKTPYYYFYSNILLLFTSLFLFPFILFRIRQDINTPLWIQIFYAVFGILEFISTFVAPLNTKLTCVFMFLLMLAPFWLMLIPQFGLIIIFWGILSTKIRYPTIVLGFLLELLVIQRLYKKISITYSVGFIMTINQAVVLITVYCENTYLTKVLLALTILNLTRTLDFFDPDVLGNGSFHPFGCFLKAVYANFDLENCEKCPKIREFIKDHMKEFHMKEFKVETEVDDESKRGVETKIDDDELKKDGEITREVIEFDDDKV
ncbi:hypothetical protein C1646_674251 [Rhizophagus diaphanus]|nr:hypothetical protein C1646_674251 [Rhizophagus diaphanus] [Rhizophagus sp. MUCL 43196]